MPTPIPSLSTQGFITELSSHVDYLLAYFISTDKEQSTTFKQSIISLQSILESHTDDPQGASDEIGNKLQIYFGRYYTAVNATAKVELTDPDNSNSLIKITLSLNFTEDGQIYPVSRLLTYYNGKYKEISIVNNG